MMELDILVLGDLATNCYILTCLRTRAAVVIDPGADDPSIMAALEERQADVRYVLNTHAHFDHIEGNAALIALTGAPLALHSADCDLLRDGGGANWVGLPVPTSPDPDVLLNPGEILEVGDLRLSVLFTPGHTPGHVSFYVEDHKALFAGDVLFHRGIGRSDFPGGDARALLKSIAEVLFALPDDVIVYPGHGPQTTIGEERRLNPFL